jgi:signal transduction histidine kinase
LWLVLCTIVAVVGANATFGANVFDTPPMGGRVTAAIAVTAVVCSVSPLLWAVRAVRSANQRTAAALRDRRDALATMVHAQEGGDADQWADDRDPRRARGGPWTLYRHDVAQQTSGHEVAPHATAPLTRAAQNVPGWLRAAPADGAHEDLYVKVMFVKIAGRLQSFIGRALAQIEDLESAYEDPDLLAALWRLDHLLTIVRRQAENLAVLGGQAPDRRSAEPVPTHQVLLNAIAEIERFKQVDIIAVNMVGPSGLSVPDIRGQVAVKLVHLLAELLDNATQFSSPDGPKVEIRATRVTAGLAIEISDRGVGIDDETQILINRTFDGTEFVDTLGRVHDGRTGLAVVRELATPLGIKVQLQRNIFGGVVAAVVIPPALLVDEPAGQLHLTARRPNGPSTLASPEPLWNLADANEPPTARAVTVPQVTLATTLAPARHGPDAHGGEPSDNIAGTAACSEVPVGDLSGPGPATEPFASVAANDSAENAPVPPLPVRGTGRTYMPPELAEPVPRAAVAPGHRPDLLRQVRAGRLEGPAWPAETSGSPRARDSRGGSYDDNLYDPYGQSGDGGRRPAPPAGNDTEDTHTTQYMTRGDQSPWPT